MSKRVKSRTYKLRELLPRGCGRLSDAPAILPEIAVSQYSLYRNEQVLTT